ncbi:GNAT family N-acetyltransferase [Bacillus sp. JJ722]|uniref:GNAT family N-acetyltransferase n=1 Tax=Bacillus sp. JJ722 TaxID=3122973 RepID=UPI00300046C3
MNQLHLVKYQENDFEAYFSLVSNEKVMEMITERAIPLEEAQLNFRKLLERNRKYEHFGSYKIYDITTNEYIGFGHLTLNEDTDEEAEIGYMILPKYWGMRFGSAIAKTLVEKAKHLKLKRIKAIIDPNNVPSRKILINQGFISEEVCKIDGLPGEILSKNLL